MIKSRSLNFIDKLAWIEIKDGCILSTKSFGKDKYYIPGGKREKDETDEEALCREIKEELCVNLIAETMHKIGVFTAQAHGHPEGTMVQMTCYTANYNGTLKPASEIQKLGWLTSADIKKISPVDVVIFSVLKEQGLLL